MTVAPGSVRPRGEPHGPPWLPVVAAFLLGGLVVGLVYHFGVGGSSSRSASEGSGVAAAQVRHVPAFSRLELAGSNNVVVRVGGRQSVVVRGDDNLLERVTTEVRSRTLVVGNTPGSFSTNSPMRVEVTVPTLEAVALTGSGNVVGSGRARRLDITLAGSGNVQFTRVVAKDVRAVVSGSGRIAVTATESIDALVSGTGTILYFGNPPLVTKRVSGTGTIAAG